jgi:hypothetical protein
VIEQSGREIKQVDQGMEERKKHDQRARWNCLPAESADRAAE